VAHIRRLEIGDIVKVVEDWEVEQSAGAQKAA